MMVIKAHLHSHYINHETIINYRKFVEAVNSLFSSVHLNNEYLLISDLYS